MRITEKDLDIAVERLNELTGNPIKGILKDRYILSASYGGWRLDQLTEDKSGTIRTVSGCGHISKRELYEWIQAYMSGIETKGK